MKITMLAMPLAFALAIGFAYDAFAGGCKRDFCMGLAQDCIQQSYDEDGDYQDFKTCIREEVLANENCSSLLFAEKQEGNRKPYRNRDGSPYYWVSCNWDNNAKDGWWLNRK